MTDLLPSTISEVLQELQTIIKESIATNDARGIFAYVYYRTTIEIKKAIEAAEFADNEGLHYFDVTFANFYLKAYRQFVKGEDCSLVWKESFEGCKTRLTIIQHILLGMNAHINLDLGLSTAFIAKDKDIQKLEADFLKVNTVLARIVDDLQNRLARVSPLFFLVDWLGQNSDEKLINFSMQKARAQAWRLALDLHKLDEGAFAKKQKSADQAFALFAQQIRKPNLRILRWILLFISWFEEKNVARVIEKLEA